MQYKGSTTTSVKYARTKRIDDVTSYELINTGALSTVPTAEFIAVSLKGIIEEGGGFERRMTILLQPYDPKVGVSVGMMFGLALKKETEEPTFGSHTGAGGFEAGHITPTFVGAKVPKIGEQIIQHGDAATHKVGANQGGVPEAMTQTNLIEGVDYKTRTLDMLSPHPIGLKTHATLEGDNGLIVPEYPGALRTAMGAAANSLGEEALDKVGELVDSAIAGAPDA